MTDATRLMTLAAELAELLAAMVDERVDARAAAPDRLLSVSEAAARLRVGRTTAYLLIAEGRLRSIKLRGRRMIPESSLSSLMDVEGSPHPSDDFGLRVVGR
jgi:excisionase family DNA binding protein